MALGLCTVSWYMALLQQVPNGQGDAQKQLLESQLLFTIPPRVLHSQHFQIKCKIKHNSTLPSLTLQSWELQ